MRISILARWTLALLIGFAALPAMAQTAATVADEPPFDPATIISLQMDVLEVRHDATAGRHDLHLRARAGDVEYDVHVAPQWFVDDAEWTLAAGDTLLVTGSEQQRDGKPALIAMRIERGELSLQLRDEVGVPLWAGGRRATDDTPPGQAAAGMGMGCGMGQPGGMGNMHQGGQGQRGMGNMHQGGQRMGMMCMRQQEDAEDSAQAEGTETEAQAPMCCCRMGAARPQQGQQR